MLNLHWPMRSLMSATNFYAKDIFVWIRILRKAEWYLTGLLLSKIRGSLPGSRVQVQSHRPHPPTPSPRERERCVKSLINFYSVTTLHFFYSALWIGEKMRRWKNLYCIKHFLINFGCSHPSLPIAIGMERGGGVETRFFKLSLVK